MHNATSARLLLPWIAVVLLAGCSMTRLLYDQADWLLLRELDRYLALESEQREQVASALEVRLERHRREELPGYARVLRAAAARVRDGRIDEADARWMIAAAREHLAHGVDRTLPLIASAMTGLNAEQQQHLADAIAKRNADYRERHHLDAPRDERFARRAERAVERIEDWVGTLRPEQVALVTEIRDAMPDTAPMWLRYTEDRQQRLLALVATRAPQPSLEAYLRGWWLGLEALPEPLARWRDAQISALVELVVRLDRTLDDAQRRHLVDRLEALARDAEALSAQAA